MATNASAPRVPRADRPASTSATRPTGNQALCPPQLNYLNFLSQASTESQGPWDSNYQVEDDYSWFLPGKHGDHDMKFGVRYNYTALRRVSQVNQNGTFTFNTNAAVRLRPIREPIPSGCRFGRERSRRTSRTTPTKRSPRTNGTSARRRRSTSGFATISRSSRSTRPAIRCSAPGQKAPTDKNNISPRRLVHPLDGCGRQVGDPRRIRDLLQPDDPRRRRRHAGVRQVHRRRTSSPSRQWHADPGSERGTVPDRPVPGQRPVRQPHPAQPVVSRRVCRC